MYWSHEAPPTCSTAGVLDAVGLQRSRTQLGTLRKLSVQSSWEQDGGPWWLGSLVLQDQVVPVISVDFLVRID